MGRDSFFGLSMKSAKEREREDRAFFQWAFPYGKAQQERVKALLKELFPRERPEMAMVAYLTAREAYRDRYGDFADDPRFDPVAMAFRNLERNNIRLPREDIPLYVALLVADSQVGEDLAYPSREELLDLAEVLKGRQR